MEAVNAFNFEVSCPRTDRKTEANEVLDVTVMH